MSPDQSYWSNAVFLAFVTWREARGASYTAKLAIAYSILQRVNDKAWWGNSILEVVGKRLQYSSMTAPGDPNLTQYPTLADPSYTDCVNAAVAAIARTAPNPAPTADSYYDTSIAAPYWANPDLFVIQIQNLKFYNLDKDYEQEAMVSGEW